MPKPPSGPARTLVGVDIGSTHIKAVLVDTQSGVVHVARRATDTHVVRGGGAFHRPEELLAAVSSAIGECVADTGSRPKPSGIGIASMAEAGCPVDRRKQPVGEIMAWHDPRPDRQAAWLERQVGAQQLFSRTGLRPEPKYTLPKLLWLREQKAAEFTRLRHWAGVAELVGLDLTGELATNASLACRTMAFDVTRRTWIGDLLAFASLEPEEMPRVLPLGQSIGGLTAAAATRLGLPSGTPVAIAGHDHLAAALGAGVTKPGDALDSMGSAEATLLVTEVPALAEEVRRGGFSTGCHAVDGLSYVVGGLQSSGALIEWFTATFLAGQPGRSATPPGDEAGLTGIESERYGRFIELLDLAGNGPAEPVVLPYLRGRTAPHRDPAATLEIEGLRENHNLVDLAAAVVDGAAYHVRWMLDELSRVTETPLDRIRLTGGGARNRRWVVAKAALGPGRLEVVRTEEAAAFGAALVAGVAGGVYGSVAEALAAASPFDRVIAPASIRARYDAAYLDRWLPAAVTRLRRSGF